MTTAVKLRICLIALLAFAASNARNAQADLIGIDQQQSALVTVHADGTVSLRSGLNGLDASFDGIANAQEFGFFAVSSSSGQLHRIHPSTGSSIASWDLGLTGLQSLAFDSVGSQLITAASTGQVYSVNLNDLAGSLTTLALTVSTTGYELPEGGFGFSGLTFAGGNLFAISGGRDQLFRFSRNGTTLNLTGVSSQFDGVDLQGLGFDGTNLWAVSSGNTDNRQLLTISTNLQLESSVGLSPNYVTSDIRGLTSVPEPQSLALLTASAYLMAFRRKRRQHLSV